MSASHPLSTQLLEIVAQFETDLNSAAVRQLKRTAGAITAILDQQHRTTMNTTFDTADVMKSHAAKSSERR